jgi:hypothetical protein
LEIYEEDKMEYSRLQERTHPMDNMEKEIEEIRRFMLKTTQEAANNRWRLKIGDFLGKVNGALQHKFWKQGGDPVATTGQKQHQKGRRAGQKIL